MPKINIKPMSVNKAWMGKRFKTREYKFYEIEMMLKLPKMVITFERIHLKFVFGMSQLSDLDNPLKLTIDILQKKYKFNDRYVMKIEAEKEIVKKGQEFISFEILECV